MTCQPTAHVSYDLVPVAAASDAKWREDLKATLPDCSQSLSSAIISTWPSVLRAFVIEDLCAGRSGDMTHVWKDADCLVVYRLRATAATLNLLGYNTNIESLESSVIDFEGFAIAATCIPCTQTEDACFQDLNAEEACTTLAPSSSDAFASANKPYIMARPAHSLYSELRLPKSQPKWTFLSDNASDEEISAPASPATSTTSESTCCSDSGSIYGTYRWPQSEPKWAYLEPETYIAQPLVSFNRVLSFADSVDMDTVCGDEDYLNAIVDEEFGDWDSDWELNEESERDEVCMSPALKERNLMNETLCLAAQAAQRARQGFSHSYF